MRLDVYLTEKGYFNSRSQALLAIKEKKVKVNNRIITKAGYDINENENLRTIEATLFCKKESQKGIIIGKNGSMIKKIGTMARKIISQKFHTNVNLKLIVKINKNWINNEKMIKKFHY